MTGFSEDGAAPYRAPPETPMTKAAFLHWVQSREGRFELKDGRVIMQAGGTRRHSWIMGNFVTALANRLDPDAWAVAPADLAVAVGNDIRYPDVVVERRSDDGASLATEQPVLLVEVLSPSSRDTDLAIKLAEYTSLASLEAYIVASQDGPRCWIWQRGASLSFPEEAVIVEGAAASILLKSFGIALPLAEVYRGIVPPRS